MELTGSTPGFAACYCAMVLAILINGGLSDPGSGGKALWGGIRDGLWTILTCLPVEGCSWQSCIGLQNAIQVLVCIEWMYMLILCSLGSQKHDTVADVANCCTLYFLKYRIIMIQPVEICTRGLERQMFIVRRGAYNMAQGKEHRNTVPSSYENRNVHAPQTGVTVYSIPPVLYPPG